MYNNRGLDRPKNYEKIFADPKELAKLVEENKQIMSLLEKARDRLIEVEKAEEGRIEEMPPGSVWDNQEKNIITSEIRKFDPELANDIAGEKNKKKLVKRIEKRISEIEKENEKFDRGLGKLKERQKKTMEKGGKLVEKILKQMAAIRGFEKVEVKIMEENIRIKNEIKKHLEIGDIGFENIDDFVKLAKRLEENNKKNLDLRKKVADLRKGLEELKKEGAPIETEFIEESKEIRQRRKAA